MSPNYSDATLVCYYQNVRGLNSKTHDFYSSVLCDDCDIVCLSETWLSAGVADSEIFPPDYDVFRHDRDLEAANSATGGGALLAFRSCLRARRVDLSVLHQLVPTVDVVGCVIRLRSKNLLVFGVYVPPKIDFASYDLFFEALSSLDIVNDCQLLILGDFNTTEFVNSATSERKLQHSKFFQVSWT